MFYPITLLLVATLHVADGDTVKKKAPPPPPAAGVVKGSVTKSKAPAVTLAGSAVPKASTPAPARKPLLGEAITRSIASTARAVAPRATYLSNLIRHRASRGPDLPPGITANANAVPFSADSIVIEKSRRTMTLYRQGTPVRIYFVALGQNPVGKKMSQGDNRTPEGLYYIEGHNPGSKYHLSLKISYPNEQDEAEAHARGLSTGGDIMIHGLPRGFENVGAEHRNRDWTNGCVAVTNAEIEEIWSAIPDGAAVYIKP
jgi:hypothetical protein